MDASLSTLKDALIVGKEGITFFALMISCYISIAAHKRISAHEDRN
jgi:hypothetical protein